MASPSLHTAAGTVFCVVCAWDWKTRKNERIFKRHVDSIQVLSGTPEMRSFATCPECMLLHCSHLLIVLASWLLCVCGLLPAACQALLWTTMPACVVKQMHNSSRPTTIHITGPHRTLACCCFIAVTFCPVQYLKAQ